MEEIKIKYLEEGNKEYQIFINGHTQIQESNNGAKYMLIKPMGTRGKVEFIKNIKLENNESKVWVKMMDEKYQDGDIRTTSKVAYMCIKFTLPKDGKPIQQIAFEGDWCNQDERRSYKIEKIYKLNDPKSSSNAMKNAPSVLKSEISDIVKTTGETDEISVTGAVPGENIKIYSVSGAELKSVVANDDVVNIKLPKNHIYIVKAGQTSYKVAL